MQFKNILKHLILKFNNNYYKNNRVQILKEIISRYIIRSAIFMTKY